MEATWKAQIQEFLVADAPKEPKFEQIEELEEEQLFSSNDPSGSNTDRQLKKETTTGQPTKPLRKGTPARSAPLGSARNKSASSDPPLKQVVKHPFFNHSIIENTNCSQRETLGSETKQKLIHHLNESEMKQLLRKRSQDLLGGHAKINEQNQSFGSRNVKFTRQWPNKKVGYTYQLPQHLFQSLITNKRLHGTIETVGHK